MSGTIWQGTIHEILFVIGAAFITGVLLGTYYERRRRGVASDLNDSVMSYLSGMEDMKMVLVVRADLKMGKGKIGAQCGHAVLGAYKQLFSTADGRRVLHAWEDHGQPKVVLKTEGEEELLQLLQSARTVNLNVHVVRDAGRTQIAPGSKTVLAIGPGGVEKIDQVTGHLKLL